MSALDAWMISKIGPNWKTSVTGISRELMAIGATGSVVVGLLAPQHKAVAAVCAVLFALPRTLAGVLSALAQADAPAQEERNVTSRVGNTK